MMMSYPSDASGGNVAQPGTKQGALLASSPLHCRLCRLHLHFSATPSDAGDGEAGLVKASLHTTGLLLNLLLSSAPPVFSLT
ncbi:hypothetical protein QYF36_017960 [Acer negundo]|nr:hypothetical protein QYF36_017960 [Acer negundo]